MSICIPNRAYIGESRFDFGTFVGNLLKYRPLALQANQSCELDELCTLMTQ